LSVGIWGIATATGAAKGAAIAGTAFGVMAKAKTIVTMGIAAKAVVGAGTVSAANGLGFLSGAKLATVLIGSAVGGTAIITGIGVVCGIG